MALDDTLLAPPFVGKTNFGVIFARTRIPLTPFFLPRGTWAGRTKYSVAGDGAHSQYNFDETSEHICGKETYTTAHKDTPGGDETRTWSLTVGADTITWEEDVELTGTLTPNPAFPDTTTITATVHTYTDDDDEWTRTLSVAVVRSLLSSALTSLTDSHPRAITYGSSKGQASSTESDEGEILIQEALGYRGQGPRFLDSWTVNITGSLEAFWEDGFDADVEIETRTNLPRIVGVSAGAEASTDATDAVQAQGMWQHELSDSAANYWRYNGSEFEWAYSPSADPRTALTGVSYLAALEATKPRERFLYLSYADENEVLAQALLFISRTGRRYRITFEILGSSYDEETFEEIILATPVATYETSIDTLSVRVSENLPDTAGSPTWRIGDIALWTGTEADGEWVIIAGNAHLSYWTAYAEWIDFGGDEPEPPEVLLPLSASIITTDVTDTQAHILLATQFLYGQAFGYVPLDGSTGDRYRTRTTTWESTTASSGTVPAISCGGSGWPNGSMSVQYSQSYRHGSLDPICIITDEAEIDGDPFGETHLPLNFLGSTVTRTPTLLRSEWTASDIDGAYTIRLDAPSDNGTLISRQIFPHSLQYLSAISTPFHAATWAWQQATAGTTLIAAGQRLRPRSS